MISTNINWCCKHNTRENWSMLSIWQFYSWTFSHENEFNFSQVYTFWLLVYLKKFLWNQHSKLRSFWSPWRVEKSFGDQNSGESRVMVTILQLKVSKRKLFEKVSLERWEYTFPHFLPFNLLSKSLISSDSQWLAKLVLVVQLWSLQKISGQKNNFVEGEWWTMGGVWFHGHCARLEISSSLGSSPGWGHCAVFWDTVLTL